MIKLGDDPGKDASGITREWLELVIEELFSVKTGYFFYPTEDLGKALPIAINKLSDKHDLGYYRFLGRLIARAIITKNIADVRFDKIIWKHILELPCTEKDFEQVDPLWYRNFISLKEDPSLITELYETFSEDGVDFIKKENTKMCQFDTF